MCVWCVCDVYDVWGTCGVSMCSVSVYGMCLVCV